MMSLATFLRLKFRCCMNKKTRSEYPQDISITNIPTSKKKTSRTITEPWNTTYPTHVCLGSERNNHRADLEMDVYRENGRSRDRILHTTPGIRYIEEYDSDWEDPQLFQSFQNFRIQDRSVITVRSSDSESDDPEIEEIIPNSSRDTRIDEVHSSYSEFEDPRLYDGPVSHNDNRLDEVHSSYSEFEDIRLYDGPVSYDDNRLDEVRSSDSDFEDPRLFDAIHNSFSDNGYNSSAIAGQEDYQLDEAYDPDFEDPRLFRFISENEESASAAPTADLRRDPQRAEDHVEKHLWPCVVCVEKPPETIFTPCLHSVCCQECANQVKNRGGCPICSSSIAIVERIYFTQATCVVCMDSPPEIVFKPCCHAVCCKECSRTIVSGYENIEIESQCPVCKAYIEETDCFRLAYS